tara:strand:+ start:922 stop:1335 length:414 start_codon:yes stop_codon:yes gene_type:complete
MKNTCTQIVLTNYVRYMLSTNPVWALRGLVKIYERQTADEQASGTTNNLNSVGFSGVDSQILSSFAVQYQKWNKLSDKQMAIVFKKMQRYSKQIISCVPEANLPKLEQDALNHANLKSAIHTVPTVERDPELDVANP